MTTMPEILNSELGVGMYQLIKFKNWDTNLYQVSFRIVDWQTIQYRLH